MSFMFDQLGYQSHVTSFKQLKSKTKEVLHVFLVVISGFLCASQGEAC